VFQNGGGAGTGGRAVHHFTADACIMAVNGNASETFDSDSVAAFSCPVPPLRDALMAMLLSPCRISPCTFHGNGTCAIASRLDSFPI
jgi:hypothetical protein